MNITRRRWRISTNNRVAQERATISFVTSSLDLDIADYSDLVAQVIVI